MVGILSALMVIIVLLAGCNGGNAAKMGATDKGKELVYATSKDINDMNPHLYPGSLPTRMYRIIL